jgi:hypothetical protein
MLFSRNNTLSDSDPLNGKNMGSCITLRGRNSSLLIAEQLNSFVRDREDMFMLPDSVKVDLISPEIKGFKISGCNLSNSHSISNPLNRNLENYKQLYRRKAFFKWYEDEGVDMEWFSYAED